jgi:hypothetical protein
VILPPVGKRWSAMRAALTKPPDTFSGWALTVVLVVTAMGLIGWFFDDFRMVAVVGTAALLGAAMGTASRARNRRSGRSRAS